MFSIIETVLRVQLHVCVVYTRHPASTAPTLPPGLMQRHVWLCLGELRGLRSRSGTPL
jgi:hypothetical protein